jgi:hypothetical protein
MMERRKIKKKKFKIKTLRKKINDEAQLRKKKNFFNKNI